MVHIDINELCNEYLKEGVTSKILAKKYKCSITTIIDKLKRSNNLEVLNKIKNKSGQKLNIDKNLIIQEYLKSKTTTIEDVAKIFKCSGSTIRRILLNSNNKDVINKINKIKNIDIKILCNKYLENQTSIKILTEKYNCSYQTISKLLKNSGNNLFGFEYMPKYEQKEYQYLLLFHNNELTM